MSPRHFVTVPDSDDDIVEEVNYLRKTKRGMKTTKKQVPMTHPPHVKAGEASHLHSRSKSQRQAQLRRIEHTSQEVADVGDMDTYQFTVGNEDHNPDPIVEEMQPQAMVRLHIFFHQIITDNV
jgi:hypothetical protein